MSGTSLIGGTLPWRGRKAVIGRRRERERKPLQGACPHLIRIHTEVGLEPGKPWTSVWMPGMVRCVLTGEHEAHQAVGRTWR